jgi:outer membrane protein OmpA-like peptidoglycan-associated protein
LVTQDIGKQIGKLDRTKTYRVKGYSCPHDKGTEEELITLGVRRAKIVADILVQNGFSPSKLTTVAFDRDNECKAVIVEIGK